MASDPRQRIDASGLRSSLESFLAQVRRETKVPGIAVAVSIEGVRIGASAGVVALDRDEPITTATPFHLGCITKLLLAIVVLELAWQRQLDLNVPIEDYLPELRGTIHGKTVTLSHLLSHTSGYRGLNVMEPGTLSMRWDDLVEHLGSAPQHFTPGTVFSYEHSESVVVGEIVRRVTGESATALISETIFARLGLTPHTLGNGDAPFAAGQHVLDPSTRRFKQVRWSDLAAAGVSALPPEWEAAFSRHALSVEALVSIAELVMGQHGSLLRRAPLSAATVSLLQSPAVEIVPVIGGALAETLPATFGLGASRWRDGFCGIAGATYGQCQGFRFDARTGIAVAVGINAQQRYLRDLVIGRICETLASAASAPQAAPADFPFEDVVGEYHGARNDRLFADVDDGRLVLVLESGAMPMKLRAEIIRAPDGRLVLSSPAPDLSVGVFRTDDDDFGIMIGVSAYRRVRRV
ncbi:MAG: serine hydrolase domain-containing protein [Gammaproteobacteria bacterium]|nr:hypothetical protein [Gammaproteobacteria bacterium]